MTFDDLENVTQIDQSSFPPLWQISQSYLELAFRQASIATIAEIDGVVAGFQISTATSAGGHLARLAVDPALQGQGVGYTILHDLLTQFNRRGAQVITVNTQENNQASIRLYLKAGFEFTGERYPIYQLELPRA